MLRAYSKFVATGKQDPADPSRIAADYGSHLLATFGLEGTDEEALGADRHPALAWAASGAMALTGHPDGPPVAAPGHLAAVARGALGALTRLAGPDATRGLDGPSLLGERAALLGLDRRGPIAPGGSCRLLRARDGWIAVNLARPDDRASLPAWLGIAARADAWEAVAAAVADRRVAPVVARARLLGLAVAPAATHAPLGARWVRIGARGPRHRSQPTRPPLVVDLSSLWAGPLATHLLARAGARVIKVESRRRPDGARRGSPAFFDLLNGGKESVALDFTAARDRAALARLVARADIVVESARPRALAQLGIDAAALVASRPGLTWVAVTGYGRTGPGADWIAFGDDASAAAGLAVATGRAAGETDGAPLCCADAIADPLTGMHAAVAALASWRHGGGALLTLALRDVTAHAFTVGPPTSPATVHATTASTAAPAWEVRVGGERQTVLPPRARLPRMTARALGADTDAVLRELAACHSRGLRFHSMGVPPNV
jgi:crotonobetainyl-CoA:carnitine CoA-transferase CaiB-like acyl-CoA transferase